MSNFGSGMSNMKLPIGGGEGSAKRVVSLVALIGLLFLWALIRAIKRDLLPTATPS